MNASARIDQAIAEYPDWRGKALAELRRIVRDADPEMVEEWKWAGTAVWSHEGMVCSAEVHTRVIKVIFYRGASVVDPKQVFNAELEGKVRRAINLSEGEHFNERALKVILRAAVALNVAKAQKKERAAKRRVAAKALKKPKRSPAAKRGMAERLRRPGGRS